MGKIQDPVTGQLFDRPSSLNQANTQNQNNIQGQLSTYQSQLQDLQNKQSALQKYGLNDASQLTKDDSGNYVPTPTAAATVTNPYAATAATYPGYVGSLGNTPQQYNPTYQEYQRGLIQAPNNPNIQQAYQNIQNLQNQYANTISQIAGGQGLTQQTAQGREGVVQNLYANQLSAAEQALANAQQQAGLEQAGYQQAGALAQGAQGLQQQATSAAAGYTAPTTQFGVLTSPTTGQPIGGGNPMSAAFAGGEISGSQELGKQYSQSIAPAINAAQGISDSFKRFIEQNPSVNMSPANVANAAQQWLLGKQASDPNQLKLQQFLTDFAITLTPIIGSVGNQSDFKQSLVTGLIDSTAQTGSIITAMDSLMNIAKSKAQQYYQTGTGGTSNAGSQSTNSSSFIGSAWKDW
jgi:hypothetical protein